MPNVMMPALLPEGLDRSVTQHVHVPNQHGFGHIVRGVRNAKDGRERLHHDPIVEGGRLVHYVGDSQAEFLPLLIGSHDLSPLLVARSARRNDSAKFIRKR
jgi:hypothetical protein